MDIKKRDKSCLRFFSPVGMEMKTLVMRAVFLAGVGCLSSRGVTFSFIFVLLAFSLVWGGAYIQKVNINYKSFSLKDYDY